LEKLRLAAPSWCPPLPPPAPQVELAVELRKPLFMHCRDAGAKFAEVLQRHQLAAPGVLHCFTGSGEELAQCLALGLSIGITGWVCDERPERGGAELAVRGR
jgi:TatD DNase family protein